MSPRSEEFMAEARERLAGAQDALAAGHPGLSVSAAYYAMLYAARAALSEEEQNARTHGGVWHLFHESFVVSGRFDRPLFAAASRAQELREAGDYEATAPSREEAESVVSDAERFVDAVAAMLG